MLAAVGYRHHPHGVTRGRHSADSKRRPGADCSGLFCYFCANARQAAGVLALQKRDQLFTNFASQIPLLAGVLCGKQGANDHRASIALSDLHTPHLSVPIRGVFEQPLRLLADPRRCYQRRSGRARLARANDARSGWIRPGSVLQRGRMRHAPGRSLGRNHSALGVGSASRE